MCLLQIKNLYVKINNQIILKNLNLNVNKGEIHIIMGPNGAGKSTLSLTISGHKKYKIIQGEILFQNNIINNYSIDKRAKKGIFISLQDNIEIPGLNNLFFLYKSTNSIRKYQKKKEFDFFEFKNTVYKKINKLNYSPKLLKRSLNTGFSGGEKKKNDILQILLLKPKLIILDEIDSGLDIDNIKNIANIINNLKKQKKTFIIITHYKKLLNYLQINTIHIINNGTIIKSGNKYLINKTKNKGYECSEKKNK